MVSDELQTIIDKLQEQGEMNFFESASDEQISAFEEKHSLKFPSHYREWLQFCDGGELFLPAGVQFYGVAHKPFIDVDENDRPSDSYIVIGALASGDPVVFDKGKEQISIYNHEDGKIEDDEVYSDFFTFLKGLYEILGIGE